MNCTKPFFATQRPGETPKYFNINTKNLLQIGEIKFILHSTFVLKTFDPWNANIQLISRQKAIFCNINTSTILFDSSIGEKSSIQFV